MARGHRRRVGRIRVAGIALALAGAGLSVAGVASAKVVDGPNNDQTVLPVQVAGGTPDISASVGVVGGDNGDGGGNGDGGSTGTGGDNGGGTSGPSGSAAPSKGATGGPSAPASTAPSGAASGSAAASTAPGGSTSGGTGGTGGSSGGMTQAPARTQLAETGSSENTPLILLGGLTFVLGGVVFRFGPRVASARKH